MQTQGGQGLRMQVEKGSWMVARVLRGDGGDPGVLKASPVLRTRSWRQKGNEELLRVTKQSDPIRAGLRVIWHFLQGGENIRVQAENLWCGLVPGKVLTTKGRDICQRCSGEELTLPGDNLGAQEGGGAMGPWFSLLSPFSKADTPQLESVTSQLCFLLLYY